MCTDPSGQVDWLGVLDLSLGFVDFLASDSDTTTRAVKAGATGEQAAGVAANAADFQLGAAGAKLAEVGLGGVAASRELEAINREPSQAELKQMMAEMYNLAPDDPSLEIMSQAGIDREIWRTNSMGQRVSASVNVGFESIPYFGTGYKLVWLPDKIGRIKAKLFGSRGSSSQVNTGGSQANRTVTREELGLGGYGYDVGFTTVDSGMGGRPAGGK